MTRSTSAFVIAALFLSGVAIGGLGMHLYYWQKLGAGPERGLMWGSRSPAISGTGPMMGWMERELDLSTEQRDEIRRILADSMRQGGEMRRELRPRVEELMRATSERIAAVLNDEQRQRYEELRRRRGEHFERGFLGPPRGPGARRRRPGPPPGPPPPRDP